MDFQVSQVVSPADFQKCLTVRKMGTYSVLVYLPDRLAVCVTLT